MSLMEGNTEQGDGGEAPPQRPEIAVPTQNGIKSETEQPVGDSSAEMTKKEADSTASESPVTLKREENNGAAESSSVTDSAQEQGPQTSPMPQQHHVRTITLTSEYRQQESSNGTLHQQEQKFTEVAGSSSMYVEEQHGGNQNAVYYQEQQNYSQANDVSTHYNRDVHSESNKPNKLLESAAAEAGVPTNDYMITMEDDPNGDPGSSASFLGSRLASMQVLIKDFVKLNV